MAGPVLIGLDFGTAQARGVALDMGTGRAVGAAAQDYRHGTLTAALPGGRRLAPGWALQVAGDYEAAAEAILSALGRGREVRGIGVGFTASSPLPALADGTPLSDLLPDEPHAYVKLWRHAAQAQADRIGAARGGWLANFGGRVSGEWLLPKALELAEEAPDAWARTERFIEAGDWIVGRLTGGEARAQGFAAYKAQWSPEAGYPAHLVPGLGPRLGPAPLPVGSAAGALSPGWRARTGIVGPAVVAVAVIDSHVALPAAGAVGDGDFVGALGTSAVFLYQSEKFRPLPRGIEGVARDGALRALWTYEAGTASFGDTLAWLSRLAPRGASLGESLAAYDAAAAALPPGGTGLLALDWWGGNRVPHGDARLSGVVLGLRGGTDGAAIHRALLEALAFGARAVLDAFVEDGFPLGRVAMTSGLAGRSPVLMQVMADAMGRAIEVPRLDHATAVGAAIHGAVAAGVVEGYAEGARRFGARDAQTFVHNPGATRALAPLYARYRALSADPHLLGALRALAAPEAPP